MNGIFYKLRNCKEWEVVVSTSGMAPNYSSKSYTIHLIEKEYVHLRSKHWTESQGTIAVPYIAIKKIWYK